MSKLQTLQDLTRLRDSSRKALEVREKTGTVIAIGMGTCGIAAGARETREALEKELTRLHIEAQVTGVGCIGMCAREPLVEIRQGGKSRVLYGNIDASMVSKLVEEHLLRGRAVKEWIVGKMMDE